MKIGPQAALFVQCEANRHSIFYLEHNVAALPSSTESSWHGLRPQPGAKAVGMADDTVITLGATPEQDLYLTLGRAIARLCPAGFEEARLAASLDEAGAAMRLDCVTANGTEIAMTIGPDAEAGIRGLLEAIRTKMKESGGAGWRKAVVTLRKGGRFQMDVE